MMAGDLGEDYPGPSPTVGITWMEVIRCLPEFPSETEPWVPTVDTGLRTLPWLASCYSLFPVLTSLPMFLDITPQGNCLHSSPHLDSGLEAHK